MSLNGTVIVDGEKTSPPSVVCVCVFMFLLVRVFRRGFKNLAYDFADFREGEFDFLPVHVNGADANRRGLRRV